MPDLSVETSLPKVKWENLHYCHFSRIALIIQVQNQEKSMRLISNMRFFVEKWYKLAVILKWHPMTVSLYQLRLLTRVYGM